MASIQIGIVGLPNVGKSTLFNALLKKQVADVANYPFCTIEPNIGIIEVPDARLPVLAKIVKTEKIVPAVVEFYDIAGLVKGASKGEGLGNKFLSHIREVAAIIHVVRLFDDSNVVHVADTIDPVRDVNTIETELIFADLATIQKQKEPKMNAEKNEVLAYEIVKKLNTWLDSGRAARDLGLNDEEKQLIKPLNLLTMKPIIFVFNVSESQLSSEALIKTKVKEVFDGLSMKKHPGYIYLCAKMENEIVAFSPDEQKEYLKQFGLVETGLNRLVKEAYATLGLISFLTAGTLEARAWTIPVGTLAPQAAGTIHTDFEKKFIKAEIVSYHDFVAANGWVAAREHGKVTSAGKDYEMKDGDVVEFRIGA